MAERKTLQKYYPADFDPAKLVRSKKSSTPTRTVVNFACPFRSMRCLTCGHYTTKGKVFRNSPKHIAPETYLGVKIITLHCKCPGCTAQIIIETDPKNMDYRIRLNRLEVEELEGGDEKATMEMLERKTEDARVEGAVADALDEIRAANARRGGVDKGCSAAILAPSREVEDAEDAEIARAVFRGTKRCSLDSESRGGSLNVEFSVSRPAKKAKKDFAKTLGIKRKVDV
ncbi:hypothetical protein J4E85_006414 [Alternaria conjuncta]|uniref:uncharacterized protein n=1 Tax=Alternaria conjuncta TaxID=181017 RepID=UPI00221FE57B|nr:uncharacterized protein J4E85_006414 [Alternaria conjuncta]KAI4927901.1 hypothetical protein J4E85_006414 [Alternaria conjuncta]